MNNLQIAIIYSSMLGSILNEFDKSPRAVMEIRKRIKKFMYKRARSNNKEFTEAIKRGDSVWRETLEFFRKQELKIDSFALIVALWSSNSGTMEKFVNISQAKMDKFCMLNDNDLLNAELDAYKVAEYLNTKIKGLT